MKNIYKLIDAICEAYDMEVFKPIPDNPATAENERRTYCNIVVNFVAQVMGYSKFKGLLANQMVSLMETSPEWKKIEVGFAQHEANQGELVVAGWKNPTGWHGHVVIVRPGISGYSPKWGCAVPKCMNIGADVSIDSNLAYAFKEKPGVYVWQQDS